jgi:hypothetical protein
MALAKDPRTLLDKQAGNRGSIPLASKWFKLFIIRYLRKVK